MIVTDIILEQLERVVAHNTDELHDKQFAIEMYKLIKKKLTPMKPYESRTFKIVEYGCPSCKHIVYGVYDVYGVYERNEYCSQCGQAIDWGETANDTIRSYSNHV